MFTRGERVYWVSHGLRRLGTVEDSAPGSLKALVLPVKGEREELLVRRLFRARPEFESAGRVLDRAHETPPGETAVDHVKREASFVASDGSVDRFGDVLEPAGWDLKAFRRNPVFLWNHDTSAPIGTVPAIHVRDERLVARTRFLEAGISSQADQLFRLVEAGVLCAVSIGARALAEPEPIRDKQDNITGLRYGAMELLELSLVSVPANPNALALGRKYGIEESFLVSQALEVDASVANLAGYYDSLRAQVPGMLAPRPAKPSNTGATHETHIRPGCRVRQAARGQGGRARGATEQGRDGNPRPQ